MTYNKALGILRFDVCYLEKVPSSCIAIKFGNIVLVNTDYTVKFNGMRNSHFQILATYKSQTVN